jgi:aspartate-semialdehyde dehydrogenase
MVGEIMLKVLERNFPVTRINSVASERSVGKRLILKVKILLWGYKLLLT